MFDKEELKRDLKRQVSSLVEAKVEEIEATYYQPLDESQDETETEDEVDEEDKSEDDLCEEEPPVKESMQVSATTSTGNVDRVNVRNMRELNRLARTGQYERFTVTRQNGEEQEYHVDDRTQKLILL